MASNATIAEAVLRARAYYIQILDEYLVKLRGGGTCANSMNKLMCLKKLIRGLQWDLNEGVNNDITTGVYQKLILELNGFYGTALPSADNVVIPALTIVAGIAGPAGKDGLSAYQLSGYTGTLQEWLASLQGQSAYQIAVDNGFEGTQAEWLIYLQTNERAYIDSLIQQLDLQAVTDVGNRTTNDIVLDQSDLVFETPVIPNRAIPFTGFISGFAYDNTGALYAMERGNRRIVKYNADLTSSTVVMTKPTSGAGLDQWGTALHQIAFDKDNNLFVIDYSNRRVLKYAPGSEIGVVVAGGNGLGAGLNQLNNARALTIGPDNLLYVADTGNHRILRYSPDSTTGTVVAGGNGLGSGLNQLNAPQSLKFGPDGSLYVLDTSNYRMLKYNLALSPVGSVAFGGTKGEGLNQMSDTSFGFDIDKAGNLYLADNFRVLKITPGSVNAEIIANSTPAGFGSAVTQFYNYEIAVSKKGDYLYMGDYASNRILVAYIWPNVITLEGREGELYRNAKRLLTELDILDTSPFAVKTQIDDINNVRLPGKVDKDPSQTAGRVIFVGPTGKLIGQGNFTFDISSGQLKVNTTASNGNYKALIGGGLSVLSGAINMDEPQSVLYMSGGRCALLVDGNGMHYRLFNNDNSDFPDTSKSFVWRNKGFVHFRCFTEVLALNGQGQPSQWRQINEFQKFVRMPDLPEASGSFNYLVQNSANKELQWLNASNLVAARRKVSDLPLIDDENLDSLADYEEYRTSGGFTKYKVPQGASTFSVEFTDTFY